MNFYDYVNMFLDGGYSHRMIRLGKRNLRKDWPDIRPRPCSRCGVKFFTRRGSRAHFREAHGFKCMVGG